MIHAARLVLVVEDERLVARELELRLQDLGYQVAGPVSTSDEAIAQAAISLPDLVLMDIRIRGERDGISTAEILRKQFDVPVVFLTAHSDEATMARAMLTSPAGYLVKPLKETELRSAIEIAIHKHQMTRQLRERERWYSTTLKAIGDAVISTDASGLVSFMNPVAEILTGWRAEHAVGRPLTEVFRLVETTNVAMSNPIKLALDEGRIVQVSGVLEMPGGPNRSVVDSAAPIVDDNGNVLGGVLVFRDVTAQKALQRQVELADRLTSLGTMAAGVAHEINNPLAYVIANIDLVNEALRSRRQELGAPSWLDQATTDLSDAVEGALRIKRIVADLSVFARPPDEGNDANVSECMHQAVSMTQSQTRQRATVVIDASPSLRVAIDENRLVQVLVNLLLNAAQSIPPGSVASQVKLVARPMETEQLVVIEVIDPGTGMSEQVKARIFEPFFTTKPVGAGTGLGLPVVHGIVAAAGGTIDVETRLGRGTTFRLQLRSVESAAAAATPVEVSKRRAKLLVIDDEPLLLTGLKRMLSRNHDVEAVGSGADALARLANKERFDLILCDLMMPDLTGMDVFERVLAIDPEQARRMIFVTGGAFSTRAAEFLAATTNPVLEKPFEPHTLYALIAAQLVALS